MTKSELQYLFKEAETLWKKISNLAHDEFTEFIDGAEHDILCDISKGTPLNWDGLKPFADLLYHQGEVVGTLDVLRQQHLTPEE